MRIRVATPRPYDAVQQAFYAFGIILLLGMQWLGVSAYPLLILTITGWFACWLGSAEAAPRKVGLI